MVEKTDGTCCECDNIATHAPEWNLITGARYSNITEPKFCYDCFRRYKEWLR